MASSTTNRLAQTAMPTPRVPHPPNVIYPVSHTGRLYAGSNSPYIPTGNLANNTPLWHANQVGDQYRLEHQQQHIVPQSPHPHHILRGRCAPSNLPVGIRQALYVVPSSSVEDIHASLMRQVKRANTRIHLSSQSSLPYRANEDNSPHHAKYPSPGYDFDWDTRLNLKLAQGYGFASDALVEGIGRAFFPPYPTPSPEIYFGVIAIDTGDSSSRTIPVCHNLDLQHSHLHTEELDVVRRETAPPMWSLQAIAEDAEDDPLGLRGTSSGALRVASVSNSLVNVNSPSLNMHPTPQNAVPSSTFTHISAGSYVRVELHGHGTPNSAHGIPSTVQSLGSEGSIRVAEGRVRPLLNRFEPRTDPRVRFSISSGSAGSTNRKVQVRLVDELNRTSVNRVEPDLTPNISAL